jgi:hypothetical protein
MDFATGDVGYLGVQQRGQSAQNAAFGLAAKPEQNEIMTRQNGVDDLRDNGVVVTDYAGEDRGVVSELRDQVLAQFVFHTTGTQFVFRKGTSAQLAEGAGKIHRGNSKSSQPSAVSYQETRAAEWFDYTPREPGIRLQASGTYGIGL